MSLPTFTSPDELDKKITAFKKYCKDNKQPLTFARLACFVGCSREALYNYKDEGRDPRYKVLLEGVRNEIVANLEELMIKEGKPGQIFVAKNYGYTDKQELLQTLVSNQESYSSEELQDKLREIMGTDDIKVKSFKNRFIRDIDTNKKGEDSECLQPLAQ